MNKNYYLGIIIYIKYESLPDSILYYNALVKLI